MKRLKRWLVSVFKDPPRGRKDPKPCGMGPECSFWDWCKETDFKRLPGSRDRKCYVETFLSSMKETTGKQRAKR